LHVTLIVIATAFALNWAFNASDAGLIISSLDEIPLEQFFIDPSSITWEANLNILRNAFTAGFSVDNWTANWSGEIGQIVEQNWDILAIFVLNGLILTTLGWTSRRNRVWNYAISLGLGVVGYFFLNWALSIVSIYVIYILFIGLSEWIAVSLAQQRTYRH